MSRLRNCAGLRFLGEAHPRRRGGTRHRKKPNAKLRSLIRDMLDALGKGFSVNEIIWDSSRAPWKPKAYKFRDPRWFQYDRETGDALMLRVPYGTDLEPLKPFQFIVYKPHLISGKQITSGLALHALYYWMLKTYDMPSWVAFIDHYGYPIRIGKYGKKFTDKDQVALKHAVADSDIQQIVDTLNATLTVPYINLDLGEQDEYPRIDLFKPDVKNIEQIITAVEKLGPQGLKVKADELRSLIGLSNLEEDDEIGADGQVQRCRRILPVFSMVARNCLIPSD